MSVDAQRFDEDGDAVQMFENSAACLSFCLRLEEDDENNKSPIRKQILAMRNLAPPRKRTKSNADQMNVNWGDGKAALKERLNPYLLRLTQEREPLDLETWAVDPTLADNERRALRSAASKALTQWPGSKRELSCAADDMGVYGWGAVVFPEDGSPIFERIPQRRVFFPADSPPDISKISAVVVKHKWYATDLYRKWRLSDKVAKNLGWNKDALKGVMQLMHVDDNQFLDDRTHSWEVVEEAIKRNHMRESIAGDSIDVFQVVYRDFEGTFGLRIVCEIHHKRGGQLVKDSFFLRELDGAYASLDQYLCIFPLDPTSETIHAIKGYGADIFPKALALSRMKNSFVDHWDRKTSTWYATPSTDAAMRMQIVRRGPFSFVNTEGGITPLEMPKEDHMAADYGALGMVEGSLTDGLPIRTNQSFGRSSMNRSSATKEQIDQLDANELTSVDVGFFEDALDRLYMEFYRRLTMTSHGGLGAEVRKVFRDELEFMGIPREVWGMKNIRLVRAKRTVGPGSPFAKIQAANSMMEIRGSLSPEGQHEVLELFVESRVGSAKTRQFVPTFDRLGLPGQNNWDAQQESMQLLQGMPVLPALGSQNDGIHAAQHMDDFAPSIEALRTGQGGEQAIMQLTGPLNALVEHLRTHIERMEQDPSVADQLERVKAPFEELVRLALAVDKDARGITAVQRQAEEQQAAEAQAGDAQMAQMKRDLEQEKMQIDVAKGQQDLAHKQQSHEQEQAHKAQAFESDQSRKALESSLQSSNGDR